MKNVKNNITPIVLLIIKYYNFEPIFKFSKHPLNIIKTTLKHSWTYIRSHKKQIQTLDVQNSRWVF